MSVYPPAAPTEGGPAPVGPAAASVPPARSFIATWMFSLLLGFLGVDRFYLGKVGTGILKLITIGGFGIWWLIDLILTLAGLQRDKEGRLLPDFEQYRLITVPATTAASVRAARGRRRTRARPQRSGSTGRRPPR